MRKTNYRNGTANMFSRYSTFSQQVQQKVQQQNRLVRSLTYLAAIALVLFFVVGFFAPFQQALFNALFPKEASYAQSLDRVEAEQGLLSGSVAVLQDNTASGGHFARLGAKPQLAGTYYYVDCSSGSDSANGTSESTAWKSLGKASGASLKSGDALLIKRGNTCGSTLTAGWTGTLESPVIVGAYGSGAAPIIRSNTNNARLVNVTGSYITFQGIHVQGEAPSIESGCNNNPKGYIIGFQLDDSSHHITIENSKASGSYAGVYVKSGSHHNRIVSNTIVDNTMMNPLDEGGSGDAGAFGVLLHGANNEVASNTISGHSACSYDYEFDGAAVEIYGGSNNWIHHNTANENDAFTELGKNSSQTSTDNVFAYNAVSSSLRDSVFLNTRGVGNNYGPILRTRAYNNSVYLTGSQSQGVVCSNCGPDILTLRNNVLWANWKTIYASTSFNESNNLYWKAGGSPLIQGFTPHSSSLRVDPQYVSPTNLRLKSTSPAINTGSMESVQAGFTTDFDGKVVPQGSAPDMGAYEL